MAFTGQLGIALSQPGNIVLGLHAVLTPVWFGFQDATPVQVPSQQRRYRYRMNRLQALGILDAYIETTTPIPYSAPFPDDPADRHAAIFRLRQQRKKRRALIEALLYQHRFDVDVVDPFLVPRTVRSMLAAGTWEPGGY
jgi:hypothetical protein